MNQICATSQQEILIIALATLLFMCCANPKPSPKWRAVVGTTPKIIEPCLSYVTAMNVNNRHTVAILANSHTDSSFYEDELYNNAFIRRIINSTNLLIISKKDQMQGEVTRNIIMRKNFTLNRFHHRLGPVRIFFLEISSLSSLDDKLQFMTHLTSVFDSRGYFIVWLHNDLEAKKPITGEQNFQKLLERIFSVLWKYFIYNVIVVTCKNQAENSFKDTSMANCVIYSWFPYHPNSRCGENTQNFIVVDRCEFMPNDNGGAFYVNYLNSSWREIYDNGHVPVSTAIMTNDSSVLPSLSSTKSQRMNDDDSSVKGKTCNQKSCNNAYYIRNYFKWEPHGIFEFRKFNDKDNHYNNNGKVAKIHGSTVADNHYLPELKVISSEFRHFFNKIPSRLNGCKFRAVLLIWPPLVTRSKAPWIGMEHKLFLDLSRFMDFRLFEIYIQRRNQAAVNATLDVVKVFDADIAFGNMYPNIERNQVLDHSIGYFYDHINWVVPLAGDQPVWLNLIHCFGLELWTLIIAVATIFIVLYARICQLVGNESFSTGVLDCVTIAAAVSKQTLPRNGIIRIILIIWIFYCFHINLLYQVELMAVLTRPIPEKQISTPSEIISNGLEFGFPTNFAVHLKRINNKESKYFIENNQQCSFETCIRQMGKRSFATIGNRMYIQHELAFTTESAKTFTFRKPVAKSFVQMYMRKGFPLRDKLNCLIRRMVEIGYIRGCQSFYNFLVRNTTIDKTIRRSEDIFLNLEHFTGAFMLLGIGSIISIIVFMIENTKGKKL